MIKSARSFAAGFSVLFLLFGLTACGSQVSSIDTSTDEVDPGISAGQNSFNDACSAYAAGSYEGAASLFREAGTMAEDEGATVLSKVLAAEYAANPIQN
jgi:hypothetical protein